MCEMLLLHHHTVRIALIQNFGAATLQKGQSGGPGLKQSPMLGREKVAAGDMDALAARHTGMLHFTVGRQWPDRAGYGDEL